MRPSTFTNRELISRLQQSYDPTLLGELLQRHRLQVINLCYRYTHDWEISQDLSQEVSLKVLTQFRSFRAQASFATWLRAVARHCCLDYLRQKKYELLLVADADNCTEFIPSATDAAEVPTLEDLEKFVNELPPAERHLLRLRYWEHQSISEIHRIMNVSESTVKTRLCRSRKKLRRLWKVCYTDYERKSVAFA